MNFSKKIVEKTLILPKDLKNHVNLPRDKKNPAHFVKGSLKQYDFHRRITEKKEIKEFAKG